MRKNLAIAILIMAAGFCGYQWYKTAAECEELSANIREVVQDRRELTGALTNVRERILVYDMLVHGSDEALLPPGADTITSWGSFNKFLDEHPEIDVFEVLSKLY